MSKNVPQITPQELAMVDNNILNEKQLKHLLQKTPDIHKYKRPGKGGGQWTFVTGTYVKKVLNVMFGWDWSFEVIEHKIDLTLGQAYVLGKLTINSGGRSVVKMQFGRVDIKIKKATGLPLDVGNDLKAATTDALKKCAAELGVASDVYAPNEFKEIEIISQPEELTDDERLEKIKTLINTEGVVVTEEDRMNIDRIIDEKEVMSYKKALVFLKNALPKK